MLGDDYDYLTYEGLVQDWGNRYPQALTNDTQPEVQQAVMRFLASPDAFRDQNVLLYWLLGNGTPGFKMSKPDSDYVLISRVRGERCSNCVYTFQNIVTKRYICSKIRGQIVPPGWCRLWEGL